MKKITVNLKTSAYKIITGYDILPLLPAYLNKLGIGKDAFIITSANIKRLFAKKLTRLLLANGFSCHFELVGDSEKSKSQDIAFRIINKVSSYARLKQVFIVALGGGVIGDLSGFVASIYKRGLPYIQLPTTLLAQVDSSIGGKVGIDLDCGKNLVGAFYQPRLVLSDASFLSTLPEKEMRNGLSEAVKYAVIEDKTLFEYIEKNYRRILRRDKQPLDYVIRKCAAIKARITSADEKETRGLRTALNFGHTIGHAIETAGGFKSYTHGEAIALGMLAALNIALELKIFKNRREAEKIKQLLIKIGLPARIKGLSLGDIMRAQSFDKKFIGGKNRFILPKKIGEVVIKEGISEEVIKNALRTLLE